MSEQVFGRSGHYLQIGWVVSISLLKLIAERLATVTKTSPDETSLKLSRPTLPRLFRKGEPVRIKYCDEAAIYYWGGEVLQVSGSGNRHVAISKSGEGVTLERRKFLRLRSKIPFSFRVITGAPDGLVSGKDLYSNKMQNMSVGGIGFETELRLKVGDELQVNFHLPRSEQVGVGGWIVRSEQIRREEEYLNSVALEFLGLKPAERSQILQFLGESQMSEETEETVF
ncbi:PilZ domain-containing protein [Acidobacteria bacterium AH-259-O06]|nr:PilZ domain-containing protein [Acidobacteria bacterium AH-259-O06]